MLPSGENASLASMISPSNVKDDDSDNVGADQAPDLGFQPTEPIDAVLLLPFRVP